MTKEPSHLCRRRSGPGFPASAFLVSLFLSVVCLLADFAQAAPEVRQSGGEPDGIVQVANLVYAGAKSSRCFSDHFLI